MNFRKDTRLNGEPAQPSARQTQPEEPRFYTGTDGSQSRHAKGGKKWWILAALCALLCLALPFAVQQARDRALLSGDVAVKTQVGLSAEGQKYPFAQELYERSRTSTAYYSSDDDFMTSYTADGPVAENTDFTPFLERFYRENGVEAVTDWQPTYTLSLRSNCVYAGAYSETLRLYTCCTGILDSTAVDCRAVSVAKEELASYDVFFTPEAAEAAQTKKTVSQGEVVSFAGAVLSPESVTRGPLRACPDTNNAAMRADGCYFLAQKDGDSSCSWLLYAPYETGEAQYVCAVSGCTHDSAACGACVPYRNVALRDLGDAVFITYQKGDSYEVGYGYLLYPETGERCPEIQWKGIQIGWNYAAVDSDGRYLYTTNTKGDLARLDMASGWTKTLATREELVQSTGSDDGLLEYARLVVTGCFDDTVTVSMGRFLEEGSADPDYIYRITGYDVKNAKLWKKGITLNLPGTNTSYQQSGAHGWKLDVSSDALLQFDLRTGECETVAENLGLQDCGYLSMDSTVTECPLITKTYYTISQSEGPRTYESLAWDPASGEIVPLTLCANMKEEQRPLYIAAGTSEWLYGILEVVPVTVTENFNGELNSWLSDEQRYGFIRTQDYFANRPNYVFLSMPWDR